jgi:hypothetical protein
MLVSQDERKSQSKVILARRYYDGDHEVKLTDRQKKFLELHGSDTQFNVNHCPTVIDAAVERLQVIGFDVSDEREEEDSEKTVSGRLWKWWQLNRMDAVQTEAHRWALRDGEAFVLIAWDNQKGRPDWVLHPRYTAPTVKGGTGYGVWMNYPNNDYLQPPEYAVKEWEEKDEKGNKVARRTVYYPDRIEKFIRDDRRWKRHMDKGDGDVWPIPWLMPDGSPIGIPVAHLKAPSLKSILRDAIPLQDLLNKAWLDLIAGADTGAFRSLIMLGWMPTTDGKEPKADGSNLLKSAPGQIIGTPKEKDKAGVEVIDPAPLTPLLELEERIVLRIASMTRTPLSRFNTTRQIAGAETLKQQDAPLLGRVRENMTLFGNGWEDLMILSLRMGAVFGGMSMDTETQINTVWEDAAIRDEKTFLEGQETKKGLGVDDETLWTEMGYDKQHRDRFKRQKLRQRADDLRAAARTQNQQFQQQGASLNGNGIGQPAAAAA